MEIEMIDGQAKVKRGRKKKEENNDYMINNSQTKFVVDLSRETDVLNKVFKLLEDANNKPYGREVTFKDLAIFSIDKLCPKDLDKIKDASLDDMEKVEKARDEYNQKNGTSLSLGEYLVKKLAIN